MAKKILVVVESPAKAKTINKYLGSNYIVEASVGHIKDLVKSNMGVDVENGYKPRYITIKGKADIVKKLKDFASKSKQVLIATDPDREGEAIAWHIAEEVRKENTNIKRVLFNEITKSGVEKGIAAPRDIDEPLFMSQQARRVVDRLIGFEVSPFLWRAMATKTSAPLSAGRVQSVALRLICERESEIRKFKPIEYWTIYGTFALLNAAASKAFTARLVRFDGRDIKTPEGSADDEKNAMLDTSHFIRTEQEARELLARIQREAYAITDVQSKEMKRKPPMPFTTSTLQQDASRRVGLNAKKTMQIAQKLYEGVSMGNDGEVGLITYMRTDSVRVSSEAQDAARNVIAEQYGANFLPDAPPVYKSKASNVQDAHEAIRPTTLEYTPQKVRKFVDKKTADLYALIYNRFLASQMTSALVEQTSVTMTGGDFVFRANGSVIKFKGFLAAYSDVSEEDANEEDASKALPSGLRVDEKVDLREAAPKQSFTKAPPRFTEATLVKELEAQGIGRPSTYAAIVSTIQDRKYVEFQDKRFAPTELGMDVSQVLVKNFPELFNVKFTAGMEEDLDTIAEGKHTYEEVMDDFYIPFKLSMKNAEEKGDIPEILCDKCGAPMAMKIGRFGAFFGCTRYPECDSIKTLRQLSGEEKENQEPVLAEGVLCDLCGSAMYLRSGRFGQFYGCSQYPKCKGIKQIPSGITCPKCEKGDIVERRGGKAKRTFWGCSRYPECDFISNYKPLNEQCAHCGNNYVELHWKKDEGEFKQCPKCRETYPVAVPTAAESSS